MPTKSYKRVSDQKAAPFRPNNAGSFAHLAAYVKKEGVPAANQRTALKGLKRLLEQIIKFTDELDWIERRHSCRLCEGCARIHGAPR